MLFIDSEIICEKMCRNMMSYLNITDKYIEKI